MNEPKKQPEMHEEQPSSKPVQSIQELLVPVEESEFARGWNGALREVTKLPLKPHRRKLPDTRASLTHKFVIFAADDAYKGYLTMGFYEGGGLGEIFVKMDRQGSQVSGFLDSWAIAVSWLLQVGVPVEEIAAKYRGVAFPPQGQTDNAQIRFTKSPVDYIVRYLHTKFVETEEE